jgi:uncharacterized protein YqgC (DUF456 family)
LGAVIPVLPGLPFSYIGILLLHFSSKIEFTLAFLIVWLIVVIVLQVLDNVLPAWGAKYFGGNKWGVWGSFVGLLIGLFLGPIGILLGSFLGAVVGELIYGKPIEEAARAGFGTFIGFIASTIAKLIISSLFIFYYIKELVNIL